MYEFISSCSRKFPARISWKLKIREDNKPLYSWLHIATGLCNIHSYGTTQFKLYTHVQAHACACTAKLKKLACAHTVACDFGVHMRDSKHTRHTRDACHELALGLLHYTCGVTTYIVLCVGRSKDKVYFIFHKVQGCCMEIKAQLWS